MLVDAIKRDAQDEWQRAECEMGVRYLGESEVMTMFLCNLCRSGHTWSEGRVLCDSAHLGRNSLARGPRDWKSTYAKKYPSYDRAGQLNCYGQFGGHGPGR